MVLNLDPAAGAGSNSLESLYRYCLKRLLMANAEDRGQYVEEVIALLYPLRDAWEQAERTLHSSMGSHPDQDAALAGARR